MRHTPVCDGVGREGREGRGGCHVWEYECVCEKVIMAVAVDCYDNRKQDEGRCSIWVYIDVMGIGTCM